MRKVLLAVTILVLGAAPVVGQAPNAANDPVAAELANLNVTLKEIVVLLRAQRESDELALLIKRVELAEARLAERERALKVAQSERRSLDSEKAQLELRLEMVAAEAEGAGGEMPIAQVDAMTAQVEGELRRVRQRATELANEVALLESSVASQSRDVQAWQSHLDRRLARH